MKSTTAASLALAVCVLTAGTAAAFEANSPGPLERGGIPQDLVRGRAVLKLHGIDGNRLELAKAGDTEARTALAELGKRHGIQISLVRAVVLGWALVDLVDEADADKKDFFPTEEETEQLIARLEGDPAIEAISAEHWWRKFATTNDPGLSQMWHLDAIGAEQAWDVTTGTSSQRVGIADTGLLRIHEDVGQRAVNGFDFISSAQTANDGNGRDADFNDTGDSCQGEPSSFHGTHVAGTIGAAANNGKGIAGVNHNAGLVIARVLGRCGGSSVDIMEGAAWMAGAQVNGAPLIGGDKVSVMNLSLGGGTTCSSFQQQVIDFIDSQGTLFVAAAGNDQGPVNSPAVCQRAVAVAAHGPNGSIASYSSFGPQVAVVAPGGDQRFGSAAGVLSSIGPQAGNYAFLQGTSMASPHVAGAVSLLQAVNPTASRASIVAALQASGTSCSGCGNKAVLSLPAALAAIGGSTPPPPPPPPPPPTVSDDAFEENDTIAQATNASCGVNDASLIAAPEDRDFFTFVPPQGRRIGVSISALNGADLDLYVLNSQGTILARSETTGGEESISGNASGQRLHILVNPFVDPNTGTKHTGGYRLTITCGQTATTQATDDFEAGGGEDVDDVITGGELGGDPSTEAELPEADVVAPEVAGPLDEQLGADVVGGCSAGAGAPLAAPLVALLALGMRRRRRS